MRFISAITPAFLLAICFRVPSRRFAPGRFLCGLGSLRGLRLPLGCSRSGDGVVLSIESLIIVLRDRVAVAKFITLIRRNSNENFGNYFERERISSVGASAAFLWADKTRGGG